MLEAISQFDFHHRLEEREQPSVVLFSSIDCGSCRQLKQVLQTLAERRPEWSFIEVDAQSEMGLVREFEVFHLPSLFLFYQGQYHCALHAPAQVDAIERAVEQALTEPAEEAP